MQNGKEITEEGIFYYKDGVLHNERKPAVIRRDGTQEWLREGLHHRLNGPAIIRADGTKEWFIDGARHRLEHDQPAIEFADGSLAWFHHGVPYRRSGPAFIDARGKEFFAQNLYPYEFFVKQQEGYFQEQVKTAHAKSQINTSKAKRSVEQSDSQHRVTSFADDSTGGYQAMMNLCGML